MHNLGSNPALDPDASAAALTHRPLCFYSFRQASNP